MITLQPNKKYVVSYSGGVCSWFSARRLIDMLGSPDNVRLVFADTRMEDPDLYRFLEESSRDLGAELVKISDGRDPWQVFKDVRYLGNSRVDPCSAILKRELLDTWINANCSRKDTWWVVGLSYDEYERLDRFRSRMADKGWIAISPSAEAPNATKADMMRALRDRGIEPPELYEDGFPHNNCGGFCVKMGLGQAALLLRKRPDTFLYHEQKEQELRSYLGKDVTILKDRRGGAMKPLSLMDFRKRVEGGDFCPPIPSGACGCAIDD